MITKRQIELPRISSPEPAPHFFTDLSRDCELGKCKIINWHKNPGRPFGREYRRDGSFHSAGCAPISKVNGHRSSERPL